MTDKNIKAFFILLLLFLIFFSFSTDIPTRQRGGFFSDESSYFSITQSIAHDFDLKYKREDIVRIKKIFRTGPAAFYLKKSKDGELSYAKFFAYPLFAAPFYKIFGVRGFLLFNGLMIFLSLLMGYIFLSKFHPKAKSFLFTLIFVLATVIPVYIWWITADLFNFFIMFTGLFFFFYPFTNKKWIYLSPVFFATAVFSKPTTLFPIAIIFLIILFNKEWKKFIILSLIALVISSGYLAIYYFQSGEINPMSGDRRSFHSKFPYEKPEYSFEKGFKMSLDNYGKRFFLSLEVAVLNLFYYFFGRFTGMFIYFFPGVFILFFFFFQKKKREDWFILASIITGILVFILFLDPVNYFGGSGSIGNRYFFTLFPLFFFLGYRGRIFRFLLVPVVISIVFLSGIYMDMSYHSSFSRYAGLSFPINLFPPEKTQFDKLPTNENPRAFGRLIRDGKEKYWVYFLNDNYHPINENSFWTYGKRSLELFLATEKEVKEFVLMLKNSPVQNSVVFKIENEKREIFLKPEQSTIKTLKNIRGLKMSNRYVYYLKFKSDNSYCPYFEETNSEDKRNLGIKVHIGIKY
ncbi:MAG: hypothetical protein ABFR75_00935 [Acidobacteriota bacterium]